MRFVLLCVWLVTAGVLIVTPSRAQAPDVEEPLEEAEVEVESERLPDLAVPPVAAIRETVAVAGMDDAADDPAIWRDPVDPQRSLILATDKKTGLVVHDMQGAQIQRLDVGRLNNVDLRRVGNQTIAVASNRTDQSLTVFRLDNTSLRVSEIGRVPTGMDEPYGLCLYHDRPSDRLFAFVPDKTGAIPVFELTVSGDEVSGDRVMTHKVPSQAEGCVADDRSGRLFVGEEARGIWRFDAVPSLRESRGEARRDARLFAPVGQPSGLSADVEGLTLVPQGFGTGGWLIASSQGDSTFAVFDLTTLKRTARFRIGTNEAAGIDAVTQTDGIDAVSGTFADFSGGLFVAQDDVNETGDGAVASQNFKLVPLGEILSLIGSENTGP